MGNQGGAGKTGASRQERDLIGVHEIPADAYYGLQSVRAAENFSITGQSMHMEMIRSITEIKKAAAITNLKAGQIPKNIADAIVKACDDILGGKLIDQFIVDPIQGGAGTSFNMNSNEVVANRAIELLGGKKGDYKVVSPNDHVNCGQSTNDVYPASGRMALIRLLDGAIAELKRLEKAMLAKSKEFDSVIKMGRTQMQDAIPIRLGQEFHAYATVIKRDIARFERAKKDLRSLNLGGTAIGTGLNADPDYLKNIVPNLSKISGLDLVQAGDLVDATQNIDDYSYVSGVVRSCAVSLSKISNDLRLMSSGPRTGFGEINLPPRQAGSSIMPGKVNPVIPEVVSQVAFDIIGNDVTIAMAVEAGQLELNAFEPIIFYNLFNSIGNLTRVIGTFIDNCVAGITANVDHCRKLVENSVGIVTAICPHIGYEKATGVAQEAIQKGTPVRDLILRDKLLSEQELEKVMDPYTMTGKALK